MTPTALGLILISAVAHASWNFYGKKVSPTLAFFYLVTVAGSILFSPVLVLHHELLSGLTQEIVLLLVATGFCQAIYLWGLAAAYHAGDMSIAYPIARSSPLIIVCVSAFVLGQKDSISALAVAGIILIFLGCLLIPMSSFSQLRLSNYLNRTTGFALIAAFATAGYSMIDDQATMLMRQSYQASENSPAADVSPVALVYVVLQGLSSAVWMSLFVLCRPEERRRTPVLLRTVWQRCLITAGLMFGTYALVVMSMAFVTNVSYVVAFRQISIPLGVMMGVIGLGEKLYLPKTLGVLITFCGLMAVALG